MVSGGTPIDPSARRDASAGPPICCRGACRAARSRERPDDRSAGMASRASRTRESAGVTPSMSNSVRTGSPARWTGAASRLRPRTAVAMRRCYGAQPLCGRPPSQPRARRRRSSVADSQSPPAVPSAATQPTGSSGLGPRNWNTRLRSGVLPLVRRLLRARHQPRSAAPAAAGGQTAADPACAGCGPVRQPGAPSPGAVLFHEDHAQLPDGLGGTRRRLCDRGEVARWPLAPRSPPSAATSGIPRREQSSAWPPGRRRGGLPGGLEVGGDLAVGVQRGFTRRPPVPESTPAWYASEVSSSLARAHPHRCIVVLPAKLASRHGRRPRRVRGRHRTSVEHSWAGPSRSAQHGVGGKNEPIGTGQCHEGDEGRTAGRW